MAEFKIGALVRTTPMKVTDFYGSAVAPTGYKDEAIGVVSGNGTRFTLPRSALEIIPSVPTAPVQDVVEVLGNALRTLHPVEGTFEADARIVIKALAAAGYEVRPKPPEVHPDFKYGNTGE